MREAGDGVIAFRVPIALAVAAMVHRDGVKSGATEGGRGAPPGVPRLPATMQKEDGRRARVAIGIGRDAKAGRKVERDAARLARRFHRPFFSTRNRAKDDEN